MHLASMARCLVVYDLDAIPEVELAEGLASSIPLLGAFVKGSDLIDAIAAALGDGEDRAPAVQPYGNRMPLCSEEELQNLLDEFPESTDLIDRVPDLDTKADLYDYIKAKTGLAEGSSGGYAHLRRIARAGIPDSSDRQRHNSGGRLCLSRLVGRQESVPWFGK